MPSTSPRSTRAITEAHATDNEAFMLRAADGHRAHPRYPDGREFDMCDGLEAPQKHLSEIRDYRGDFGLED